MSFFLRRLVTLVMMMTWPFSNAQSIIQLTSTEFHNLASTGQIDVMIDVRTVAEWQDGHIENATLVPSLQQQLSNTANAEATLKTLNLWNCRFCRVAVYCRSGARAGAAIDGLLAAGFEGPIYNGLGVGQWTNAGYELVDDPSVDDRPCMTAQAISRQGGNSVCLQAEPANVYELHQQELDTASDLFFAQLESNNATAYSFLYTLSCFCPPADYPWLVTAQLQQLMLGVVMPAPTLGAELVNPTAVNNLTDPALHMAVGDVVVSAITTAGNDVVQMDTYLQTLSILDLFDKIQDSIDRKAHDIRVVYNPDYGYPESIAIDYDPMLADEEFYVTTSNLTLIDEDLPYTNNTYNNSTGM